MHAEQLSWQWNDTHADKASFKRFHKQHPLEFKSCFLNLDRLLPRLDEGYRFPSDVGSLGFIHIEKAGLVGIGQKRTPSSIETRLYVFISVNEKTVYLLGIGNKKTQSVDIHRFERLIKEGLNKGGHSDS